VPDKSNAQQAAEGEVENFRREGGPFVVAAEDTRMPMMFMDAKAPGNPIIFANESFLKLTGYSRDEVLGHSFNFLMAQGADAKALAAVEAAFDVNDDHSSEVRYCRKDGSEFWAALFISPVCDPIGEVIQYFASFIDLTQHKEEQAQSRMLIDELNHRVKNTLSTVQAIVAQALRNAKDPEIIREAIDSRLFALSRSHDLLTRENWESADLRDVVKEAMEPSASPTADRSGSASPARTFVSRQQRPWPWGSPSMNLPPMPSNTAPFPMTGVQSASGGRSSPLQGAIGWS
jgi:PAS domain S-box-containing protein